MKYLSSLEMEELRQLKDMIDRGTFSVGDLVREMQLRDKASDKQAEELGIIEDA